MDRWVPVEAIELAKRWEGLRLNAYLCPAQVWTIGYGHTSGVKPGDKIDKATAEELLRADLRQALGDTLALCPGLSDEPSGRLAAIVDFTYNLGSGRLKASTLRRRLNAGEYEAVPSELRKWVWGGGKKLPGLVARREAEVQLWTSIAD